MTEGIIADTRIMGNMDTDNPRAIRGIQWAKKCFDDIVEVYPGLWFVPKTNKLGCYRVDLTEPNIKFKCNCDDCLNRDGILCKHYYAVRYVKSRTEKCKRCTRRFPRLETIEVHDCEHPAYYPGDRLCIPCSKKEGVY